MRSTSRQEKLKSLHVANLPGVEECAVLLKLWSFRGLLLQAMETTTAGQRNYWGTSAKCQYTTRSSILVGANIYYIYIYFPGKPRASIRKQVTIPVAKKTRALLVRTSKKWKKSVIYPSQIGCCRLYKKGSMLNVVPEKPFAIAVPSADFTQRKKGVYLKRPG